MPELPWLMAEAEREAGVRVGLSHKTCPPTQDGEKGFVRRAL